MGRMKSDYKNIGEFLKLLESIGEVRRIKEPVSPVIEISKFTDVESKKPDGGKALIFENVVDNGKKTFPAAKGEWLSHSDWNASPTRATESASLYK